MTQAAKKSAKKKQRGPDAERLKIKGDWIEAVKEALHKPRPESGWPASPERPKRNKLGK
jgi:hypothetical protein